MRFTETVNETKTIAKLTGLAIVVAASAHVRSGRIRRHLKHWLWNDHATVLLVGSQANGALGRFLQDGTKAVRVQGDEIKVAARIRMIDDYSGHADGSEIARWIPARRAIGRGVLLVHRRGDRDRGPGRARRRADRSGGELFRPCSTTSTS